MGSEIFIWKTQILNQDQNWNQNWSQNRKWNLYCNGKNQTLQNLMPIITITRTRINQIIKTMNKLKLELELEWDDCIRFDL